MVRASCLTIRGKNLTMNLEIKFGAPKNQRETVAKMFHESFVDKHDLMFGVKTKTFAFVMHVWTTPKPLLH